MNEPAFDIITIGDMCVDLAIDLGDVVPIFGQVEQWISNYALEVGGSAGIFACQAAKLGLKVGILGRVGEDIFGDFILNRLDACGVDTRFVEVDKNLKTGCGIALCRPSGDRAILTFGGSLNAVYPIDITDQFLKSGRHFHYCSYYLQTNLIGHVSEIFKRSKSFGVTISLDTNWDPSGSWNGDLKSALSFADVFLPNVTEALKITGCPDVESALSALAEIVPLIVLKLGSEGSRIATGDKQQTIPVEVIAHPSDTIGAGDNFNAGFLAGWLRGLPLEVCAEIGNTCGRASTLERGGISGQPHRSWFASDIGI
jgi:sugar/nucleoside kinase (ribokinase family)